MDLDTAQLAIRVDRLRTSMMQLAEEFRDHVKDTAELIKWVGEITQMVEDLDKRMGNAELRG